MKLAETKIAAAGVTALALASASAAAVGNGPIVYAYGGALVQIRADGSGSTSIASDTFSSATLSPDGTQIAFLRAVAPASARDVYVMRVDGSGQRLLASYPQFDTSPPGLTDLVWSPDGTKLAYLLPVFADEQLRIVDVASGAQVPVIPDGNGKALIAWSPDGKEIAFKGFGRGLPGLNVKDLATGSVRTLTPSAGVVYPAWSPDGRSIAYADDSGGEWIVAREGRTPRRVDVPVLSPPHSSAPIWSPDGRALYFSQVTSYGAPWGLGIPTLYSTLFRTNADGTGQTALAADLTPLGWSPAGDALVVTHPRASSGVYIIRPDGRCLTFVAAGRFVGWRPGDSPPRPFECVDLTVHATAPVRSGGSGLKIHLTIGNAGTATAAPKVVGRFDANVKPLAYDKRACTFGGRSFSCRLGGLASREQRSLDVVVRGPVGVLRSSVEVSHAGRDSNPETNRTATRTTVDRCWLLGTPAGETLRGSSRDELICGLAGDDQIFPGPGRDVVRADSGDDVVHARDGEPDVISCGSGEDVVFADRVDYVSHCEHVSRPRR